MSFLREEVTSSSSIGHTLPAIDDVEARLFMDLETLLRDDDANVDPAVNVQPSQALSSTVAHCSISPVPLVISSSSMVKEKKKVAAFTSEGSAVAAECEEKLVDHTYHDYEKETVEPITQASRSQFPAKLMGILNNMSLSSIIAWQCHGRAFRVKNTLKFTSLVLPNYFNTKLMGSFRKQLSLWGFKRITGGKDAGCYYHSAFLRTREDLLHILEYKKIKGIGRALKSNPAGEPDFYKLKYMPEVGPDPRQKPRIESSMRIVNYQHQRPCVYRQVQPQKLPHSNNSYIPRPSSNVFAPLPVASTSDITSTSGIVSDDDASVATSSECSYEECLQVYAQMSFPSPFSPPTELLTAMKAYQ